MPIEPDIKNKTCIVYDRGGLYTYWAQTLGEKFGKVYYYLPDSSAYPESPKAKIGTGLEEIERIDDKKFWSSLNKADLICFPDCYDGELQHYLRQEGHKVFGSGLSERLEIDKVFFLETLEEVGLPVPFTQLVKGVDDLLEYLDGKSEKWLKSLYRGDFETRKYDNMRQFKNWLYQCLLPRIGQSAKDLEVLVQNKINSVCEVGYDGNCINGEYTDNCLVGYEIKDKAFLCKVFKDVPDIIKGVNDKMAPIFKKLGYQGGFSTEIRVTEGGKPYFIDPTCRIGSPPGEVMVEMYENYAEAVYQIANGEVPQLKERAKFGAEIILTSDFYDKHELCVEFPKEYKDNIKLKMHTKKDGAYYCIPNGNGPFFGAVVAWDNDMQKAIDKVKAIAKEITCDELDYDEHVFDKANEAVKAGEKFGVKF